MPEAPEINVDLDEFAKNKFTLVVRVRKIGRFALRLKIAMALVELASKVAPLELFLIEAVEYTNSCGFACGDVEPYGFVPECGCPVHDPDDLIEWERQPSLDDFDSDDEFDEYIRRLRNSEGDSDD